MDDPLAQLQHSPAARHWGKIGTNHHHGINLPLFSLRSNQSCGIGEFTDLIPLIPWCRKLGFDIIQLLPINDGGPETSPYCALSASALNPLHLGLARLPYLDQVAGAKPQLSRIRRLNHAQRIPYPEVFAEREDFLKTYFKEVGSKFTSTYDYLLFLSRYPWLQAYALFKAIKAERQWEPWEAWPQELQQADAPELRQRYQEQIAYHCVIQYLCFKQMQEVKKTAEEAGLYLKGDIPILVNRESSDVWQWRHLFSLEYAAGAPPDMYAVEGQKWGFPLYNWEEMEKSHYLWWKQRLDAATQLYHLYRLDHVVGFFRIWGIPVEKPPKEGKFIPADPAVWIAHGEGIMRMMLSHCPMLPIGEDLGTVPPEVRACLKQLGICGTKVMRWERYWDGDMSFIPYHNYPIASMTTVSTHDSPTLALWWRDYANEAMAFARFKGWEYDPQLSQSHRREILRDSHHTSSLFHINLLNEYLALIPLMTWPKAEDERINLPGIVSDINWTYRFRPTIEEMIASEPLAQEMRNLLH